MKRIGPYEADTKVANSTWLGEKRTMVVIAIPFTFRKITKTEKAELIETTLERINTHA